MTKELQHSFQLAKKQDSKAQKSLYDAFSGKMLAIANSYIGNLYDAEDVLMNSFLVAFTKINDCKNAESFPFWLRKIVINNSINFIRKNKNLLYSNDDFENFADIKEEELKENQFNDINIEEIFAEMPIGYKLVFNLFIFENKKHSEISEILNINEGTSKSQLNKAKKWLLEYFKKEKDAK